MNKKSILERIKKYFQNFEFKKRSFLAKHKVFYALLAGTGVVLYWRGIWHFADILESKESIFEIILHPLGSIIIGVLILLFAGILVQQFVGNDIIISGIKKEKIDIEKTEKELLKEEEEIKEEHKLIKEIDAHLHKIEKELANK